MNGRKTAAGWFGPKRFGFGIGPASWQGWLVMLVFVVGAVGAAQAFQDQPPLMFGSLAALLVALCVTIFATYRRT